jgi:hypothetical protein
MRFGFDARQDDKQMASQNLSSDQQSLLWGDESLFRSNFDQAPFYLQHSLVGHPLFEKSRLIQLANLLKRDPGNISFDSGDIHVEDGWNKRPPKQYTLDEVMERIECTGAWVILKRTEIDPPYRALMNEIMSDIERLSGRNIRKETKNLEAHILLTSPGRITPFHMDNECNLLFQVQGEKDIFVFDQTDREILTEVELESFWLGNWSAAKYKARYQERAKSFRLVPGKAIHVPVNAPHWVKNDDNVSVSLSINFEWKDESLYNVYRANCFLRKMGIKPQPPGRSHFTDSIKNTAIAAGFLPAKNMARSAITFLRRFKKKQSH